MSIIVIYFILAMIIGMPIAFVLGTSAMVYLILFGGIPMEIIGQRLYSGCDNFLLLAIPLFILSGEFMSRTKITDELVNFSKLLVGKIPGALAQANIVTSIFFFFFTGAAVSDTAAIGSILIPAMIKDGYSPEYSAAVTTTSSIIGPIIPPSIIMVIYSAVTMESVGALFTAGFIPGLLIALGLSLVALFYAIKEHHPRRLYKLKKGEFLKTTKDSIFALLAPIILIGGIFSGQFTPTEAASVVCAYTLFLGVLVYKNLKWQDIKESLAKTATTSAVVLFIITTAKVFSMILTLEHVPENITYTLLSFTSNKYQFLFVMNLFLLFMGMIMETGANVILLAPILLPAAMKLGIHPLHFALLMLVNLNIGLTTPPLGVCLFVASPIAKVSIEKISIKAIPFIAIEIAVLLIITYLPELVLILPRIFGFI